MLVLEGMQAGLSWSLVLKKEAAILEAFEGLEIQRVAAYNLSTVDKLMANPDLIRNRLKLSSVITNARQCAALIEECGSFYDYLWSFVDNQPIVGTWHKMSDIPVTTERSNALSKDFKKRGFKFIGGGICYSLMQAVGLVNDHLASCAFRFPHRREMK